MTAIAAALLFQLAWVGDRGTLHGAPNGTQIRLFVGTGMLGFAGVSVWCLSHVRVMGAMLGAVRHGWLMWAGTATIGGSILLAISGVGGWWWSWPTIGMHAGLMMLAIRALSQLGVSPWRTGLAALGLFAFTSGFWELPYHLGNGYFHPGERLLNGEKIPLSEYMGGVAINSMMHYAGGLFLLALMHFNGATLRPSRWFATWFALYVGAMIAWAAAGFWTPIRWDDVAQTAIELQDKDYVAMVLWKVSKICLGFAFISLYSPLLGLSQVLRSAPVPSSRS